MIQTILKGCYVLALLTQILIRIPRDRIRRQETIALDRVTGQERALLGVLFAGMMLFPFTSIFSRRLDFANYRLPAWAGLSGMGLMAGALAVFWQAHQDLGRYWSPSLQLVEDHHLITEGIYGQIRHPMYASQWLWSLAQPLLLQNWIAGWSGILFFLPFYLLRVRHEEAMMLERFGDDYRAYMARTGAILPRPPSKN